MAGEVALPVLTSTVSIGKAHIYTGDPFTAATWAPLAMVQGRITIGHGETWSELTLSDQTGPAVLDDILMGESITVRAPLVMPLDASILPKIHTTGTRGWGFSNPQKPIDVGVAIIPDFEVGGGLKYTAATWTRLAGNGIAAASGAGAAPKHALWIWRARIGFGDLGYGTEDGGREIVEVTAVAKFSFSANVPEGLKLAYMGDPAAASPTPVANFVFTGP